MTPPVRSSTTRTRPGAGEAFTIIELLVSSAILIMLVGLLLVMVNQTSTTWRSTSGKIEQFRAARDGFDIMTRRLSQATLGIYLDYVTNSSGAPTAYTRESQLRFLSGPTARILLPMGGTRTTTNPTMAVFFQAPNGFTTNTNNEPLQNALNTWGYYIEYADDTTTRPGFLGSSGIRSRFRYRLMELMEPTERLSVYNYTTNRSYTGIDWVSNSMTNSVANRPAHVLAENIIALILLPKLSPNDWASNASHSNTYIESSLSTNYVYDSSINQNGGMASDQDKAYLNTHNQLPPVIQVTLVAVDEASAVRFPRVYSNMMSAASSANGYSNLFTNAASLNQDLNTLGAILSSNRFNYRIFTTDVMIRGAKWSSSQTN